MGVHGLWKLLPKSESPTSLFTLALDHTLQHNYELYKVGIDASLWVYHSSAASGRGENAELQVFFYRCCRLLSMPIRPLFIFDGLERPRKLRNERKFVLTTTKKRKKISESNYLDGFRAIIASFGFESLTAPGEAEATLAQLNAAGLIDAIISDDVDCFLFGSETVLRNTRVGNSSYADYVDVYASTSLIKEGFSREELVFITLISGGDYNPGLPNCGLSTVANLRTLGFGSALNSNLDSLSDDFLSVWREGLRRELEDNISGKLSSRNRRAASNLSEEFPNKDTILAYLRPKVLERDELNSLSSRLWKNHLKLQVLAETCETYFSWGDDNGILKTFEKLVWPGIFLRAVLSKGQKVSSESQIHVQQLPFKITTMKRNKYFDSDCYRVEMSTDWFISETLLHTRTRRPPNHDTIILGSHPSLTSIQKHDKSATVTPNIRSVMKTWVPRTLLQEQYPEVVQTFHSVKHLVGNDLGEDGRQELEDENLIYISSDSERVESVIYISSDSEC